MLRKHSLTIAGHATSISIEDAFWDELKRIALARDLSVSALIQHVDETRNIDDSLCSALRLFVLKDLKNT